MVLEVLSVLSSSVDMMNHMVDLFVNWGVSIPPIPVVEWIVWVMIAEVLPGCD